MIRSGNLGVHECAHIPYDYRVCCRGIARERVNASNRPERLSTEVRERFPSRTSSGAGPDPAARSLRSRKAAAIVGALSTQRTRLTSSGRRGMPRSTGRRRGAAQHPTSGYTRKHRVRPAARPFFVPSKQVVGPAAAALIVYLGARRTCITAGPDPRATPLAWSTAAGRGCSRRARG